jgi:hypothetical protein
MVTAPAGPRGAGRSRPILARGGWTLYSQNALPAPVGKFILTLRLYWPKGTPPSILDGTWKPPVLKKGQ